jgi:arylsulfatase A-like enzyme
MRDLTVKRSARWLLPALAACAIVSTPALAAQPKPNLLVILADDMGFSDVGCYGGEIATPNLDRLAANGIRYTQFYNTARCWPTRCTLATGYYPQQTHMDPPQGRFPTWALTLPRYLKTQGYRCYHSGKWHINGAPQALADAGFDHSYRVEDHNRNFYPRDVIEDDVKQPAVPKGSNYYTAVAYADHAIRCLKEHATNHAGQPFFAFLAFTTPHFPLQAPPEDIARYRDRYLAGWDAVRAERHRRLKEMGFPVHPLPPLETGLRAPSGARGVETNVDPAEIAFALPWSELTPEQRRFQATKMAIHAAMVDRNDREIGRVLDQLKAMGTYDNTVVLFFSDNGASAEMLIRGDGHNRAAPPGSGESFLCLGPGWSSAANTPFRRHKIWVHEGGVSTPLIVHWPDGLRARGEWRHDVGHVVDLLPTFLELAGMSSSVRTDGAPPFPGRSLVPSFARDGAVQPDYIFFHHSGHRALRVGDWKLVSAKDEGDRWELYNLATDRGEITDLAGRQPDRVSAMAARWQQLDDEFKRQAGPVRTNAPARRPAAQ